MTIPALPAAPAPTDTPAEFNSKAFAFLAALDPWGDAADALAVEVNEDAAAAAQSALDATSNGAAQVVLATAQAEISATQAGIATTKAGEALSSANAAAASEIAAGLSATSAAASFDSFDDRYLGAKTSNPTLDNDGNALLTGALYFNSSVGEMRVYNGSAWAAAYIPAEGYLTDSDIGTTVQAYDSDLTNWAGIATSAKQDTLVSGTNIKTIGGQSVLGSGDLEVGGGGSLLRTTVFTSSGTWTKGAGTNYVKVYGVGGGGGGGGADAGYYAAGGGGAGGYFQEQIATSGVTTVTVTIGAGGSSGAGGGGGDGGAGGTTSFGAYCSGDGGSGGQGSSSSGEGGNGGAASGGDLNSPGGDGGPATGIAAGTTYSRSGSGGASYFGGGGKAAAQAVVGRDGQAYGSGGGGGRANNSSSRSGGAGAAGVVIVEEYA